MMWQIRKIKGIRKEWVKTPVPCGSINQINSLLYPMFTLSDFLNLFTFSPGHLQATWPVPSGSLGAICTIVVRTDWSLNGYLGYRILRKKHEEFHVDPTVPYFQIPFCLIGFEYRTPPYTHPKVSTLMRIRKSTRSTHGSPFFPTIFLSLILHPEVSRRRERLSSRISSSNGLTVNLWSLST